MIRASSRICNSFETDSRATGLGLKVSRSYPSGVRTRVLTSLLLMTASLALALAGGELLARKVRPLSTLEYVVDADVGQILNPNQRGARSVSQDYDVEIATNSAGFHDIEHRLQKPPDVYRIVMLGDSFMEAVQVPVGQGFAQQLQGALQGWLNEKRVEVINLGISGTGPAQYLQVLKARGLAYRPDLVIMAVHPGNDFFDSYRPLSGSVTKPYFELDPTGELRYIPPQTKAVGVTLSPLLRRSALLMLMRKAITRMSIEAWFGRWGFLSPSYAVASVQPNHVLPVDWYVYVIDPPYPWPGAYRITLRTIEESKKLAEQHGAGFLVMLIPPTAAIEDRWQEALAPYPGSDHLKLDFDLPSKAVRRLGKESDFHVIDFVESFRKTYQHDRLSYAWPHDGHWNARGHQQAAQVVSSFLLAHRAEYGFK